MKIVLNLVLILLSLLTIFYIFTVIRNFYISGALVGRHYIPTKEGFQFLLETLWSMVLVLAITTGSLLKKPWAWHLLLFMTMYSILTTITSLLFISEEKILNYLKLFFYFAFTGLMISRIFSNYYNVRVEKRSFYIASVAAVIVFAFYF